VANNCGREECAEREKCSRLHFSDVCSCQRAGLGAEQNGSLREADCSGLGFYIGRIDARQTSDNIDQ
jgi:hypothetical protein